jgi:hypothetical protein
LPLALIFVGVIMIVLAFRGTEREFATQLKTDFGGGQFVAWFAAVTILGGLGLVPQLRTLSNLSMALVIIVLVLRNGGLFTNLAAVIEHPPAAAPSIPLSQYGGSGGGGLLGAIGGAIGLGGGSSSGAGADDVIQEAGGESVGFG